VSSAFTNIRIAGGDTAQPLALAKRLELIRRHLQPEGGRFLDCGCGSGGYVLALVEQMGVDAYGIEFDEIKVTSGRAKRTLEDRIVRGDLQALDFPAGSWDYAMLNEVLEHVPDDRRALAEIHRILKPNGLLFIFSPNRWFPFETHGVRMKRSGRQVPHWVPFIPYIPVRCGRILFDYWARNYWQDELANLAERSGFSMIERSFVWLTFENISGRQPGLIKAASPLLRMISNQLEELPFVKRFGVSQALVCRKVAA
jgi:SAM-dependent methyltransferase